MFLITRNGAVYPLTTKTFSSRVEEQKLAFADALTQREFGMSYGQFCGTKLLSSIVETGTLPSLSAEKPSSRKQAAAAFIKGFSAHVSNPSIGELTDDEIRDLIASRYE